MGEKKDWKGDIKDAEDALKAVQDFIPALEKRDEINKAADQLHYEQIKSIDEVTRTYEQIRAIFNRGWGGSEISE
jgi:uncharacterized coiled-coil DUF342 family protein